MDKKVRLNKIAEDDASYADKNAVSLINLIVEILIESTLEEFNARQESKLILMKKGKSSRKKR